MECSSSTSRINQFLARCGLGSRREVEGLVLSGKIKINGQTVTQLSTQVSLLDKVECSGRLVKPAPETLVIAYHKPMRVITSKKDPQGRTVIYDQLPKDFKHLHYIGRLDYLSRGLLLLSNHGELTQSLTRPEFGVIRVYQVKTKHPFPKSELENLMEGYQDDKKRWIAPSEVQRYPDGTLKITLKEGKNREIRNLLQAHGHEVKDLLRIQYAGIHLGSLKEGEYRYLTEKEKNSLFSLKKPIEIA